FRLRADPDEPRLVLAESVMVRNPEPLQRRPRLALGRNVLALFFAYRTLSRGSVTRRILCAASAADECRHGDLPRLNAASAMRLRDLQTMPASLCYALSNRPRDGLRICIRTMIQKLP